MYNAHIIAHWTHLHALMSAIATRGRQPYRAVFHRPLWETMRMFRSYQREA